MGDLVTMVRDGFRNLVASLNTSRDKQAAGEYVFRNFSDEQLATIYRVSWMAQKLVDIPAEDSTREWRDWKADERQIESIETEERRLRIPQKTMLALQLSRCFGGAALYASIKNDNPAMPLDPKAVKLNGIAFVTVFPKGVLTPGDIQMDPLEPGYGKPQHYEVSGTAGSQRIHPSRLSIFVGKEILWAAGIPTGADAWGDSVIQGAYEAVRNADATATSIASLVYEAKVDVLQIPDLANIMDDPRLRRLLEERVVLAATLKGNNGILITDKEEEYSQKIFNFAGLPDINDRALQAVSGAADIPITRFLGQTPSGINSTGESDLRNYYDSIKSKQRRVLTPAMHNLDEALIRSALGNRPEEIRYEWASLWQMSDKEKAEIGTETSKTIDTLVKTALFDDDSLAEASINLLNERDVLPGLELSARAASGNLEEERAALGGQEAGLSDATEPRTLFVSRKVLNAGDIVRWARSQGIASTLKPEDMHVTIAFSRTPVDWTKIEDDWSGDEQGRVRIKPGGPRVVEKFGEGAKVLVFVSRELEWRNRQIREAGASWDWGDYSPHITITYGEIPVEVEPYQGPIVLGPERFQEINENWRNEIEEQNT